MQPTSKISQIFFQINRKIIFSGNNLIAIYTTLKIMNLMESLLGIEAMLEYLEHAINYTARVSPDIAETTEKVLKIIDIERIYREILDNDKESA